MDNRVSDERLNQLIADRMAGVNMVWPIEFHSMMRELRDRRAAERETAKPSWADVDLAAEPDRTVVSIVKLHRRPKWLRDLLDTWERRSVDYIAQGRYFDAVDLRARAIEVRLAHNERRRAKLPKWARRLQRMEARLRWDGDAWVVYVPSERGDEVDAVFEAATPQSAVKLARKAWKEAQSAA